MSSKKYQRAKSVLQKRDEANFCFYCWRPMTAASRPNDPRCVTSVTIDHFIPLNRGGKNTQYNLVICCDLCNKTKAHLMPQQFSMKINNMWQTNTFLYSKKELQTIMRQVRYIINNYANNKKLNTPYYLTELPTRRGLLESLRIKHNNNEISFSYN